MTVNYYDKNIDIIRELSEKETPINEIDVLVKIDDDMALAGIDALKHSLLLKNAAIGTCQGSSASNFSSVPA